MAVFSYRGMDAAGKKISGIVDAENVKAARLKLRKQNIFPTALREGASSESSSELLSKLQKKLERVKLADMTMMTRQLATLINANIPLVDAMGALVEQIENNKLKAALSDIRDKVKEGARLSDSMRAYPKIFSNLYVNLVHAGEVSGALDIVLLRLAEFLENQARIRSKIQGVMIYPIIMVCVGSLLVALVLGFLIPKITTIFEDSEMALPLITQFVMAVSSLLRNYWYVLIALFLLFFFLFRLYADTEKGRTKLDALKLKLPLVGPIFRQAILARFARTLGTLLQSGVQVLKGLDIVKGIIENKIIAKAIDETRDAVKEGESITGPLKRSGQFPPLVLHMIAVGEKTGELEAMLYRIADTYEEQVDNKISTFMSALEPILILVMALGVGTIVLAVILPILKMNEIAAG